MDSLFDFSSFVIQVINFAIVAFVLRHFFFVPYMKYLDEEVSKRKKLDKQLSESDTLLATAKQEAEMIVDQSRVDAKVMANEILENARKAASEMTAKAQKEADEARARGYEDIEHERKAMTEELKTKVLDIAMKLNAKLFEKNETHAEFLRKNTANIKL